MNRFAFAVALAALGLAAAPAHATPEFPGTIISDLNVTCPNPLWDGMGCTICHSSNSGGLGSVTHPFGAALKAEGLSAFADGELGTLLTKEAMETNDYNCDGIPDIKELESCQWEMLATTGTACNDGGGVDAGVVDSVVYGCAAAPRSSGASNVPPALAALAVGALLVSRIRAKKRR